MLKTQSQPKNNKPKKSYHRFESFVKNTASINKLLRDNKGPVFYYFPVMWSATHLFLSPTNLASLDDLGAPSLRKILIQIEIKKMYLLLKDNSKKQF